MDGGDRMRSEEDRSDMKSGILMDFMRRKECET